MVFKILEKPKEKNEPPAKKSMHDFMRAKMKQSSLSQKTEFIERFSWVDAKKDSNEKPDPAAFLKAVMSGIWGFERSKKFPLETIQAWKDLLVDYMDALRDKETKPMADLLADELKGLLALYAGEAAILDKDVEQDIVEPPWEWMQNNFPRRPPDNLAT